MTSPDKPNTYAESPNADHVGYLATLAPLGALDLNDEWWPPGSVEAVWLHHRVSCGCEVCLPLNGRSET
jgi:hypothetical protein